MEKSSWQRWLVLLGGALAVVGQFWGSIYYLPLIGGALALVFTLWSE